jgi:phosphatidylserine/phosphatidylglycerophosphate/cardiolipin synthase-like enzyme
MKKKVFILLLLLISFLNLWAQDNVLYFINESDEALYSRTHIIENAKEEILISYYIYAGDESGIFFLSLLQQKKLENPDIKIKLLIDANGSKIDRKYLYYCEQQGIEIKEFHPLPKLIVPLKNMSVKNFIAGIKNFNMRMHDKFIIVDGEKFISGGRNIENSYFGLDNRNFNDRDMYFQSKSLTDDVRKYYIKLWNSKYVKNITYFKKQNSSKSYKDSEKVFDKYKNLILTQRDNYKELYKDFGPETKGTSFSKAIFLSSYDGKNDVMNPVLLSTSLFNLMHKSDSSVLIETPYLLPTKPLYRLLENLEKRGTEVVCVTNSNCSTDVMPISAAYDNQKKKLLKLGVEIYESIGPDYLHFKSVVLDDKIALAGSYNFDPRSEMINTELVFLIFDEKLAIKMKELIVNDMNTSVKVNVTTIDSHSGYYSCHRTGKDMMIYTLSRFLTRFSLFYNQF